MKKREHVNNQNTFVPQNEFVYPEEPNSPFLNPDIKEILKIDTNYTFLSKKFKDRLWNYFVYFVIFTLVLLTEISLDISNPCYNFVSRCWNKFIIT